MNVYVVYDRNDEVVTVGTAEECADAMGVAPGTVEWWASPKAKSRHLESGSPMAERIRVELVYGRLSYRNA